MTDSAERGGAKAPSLRTTLALLRIGPFALAGRIGIALLYATRWLRSGLVALPLRHGGELYVSRHTLESDFQTLREIFIPRKNAYGTSYAGATVLDIGAHKGYYGAYALLNGASRVYSYEPASDNYVQLERAAATFRLNGRRWETRNAAVGALDGSATLEVSAESWAHSLHAALPRSGPARAVSSEEVDVVAARTVLAEAARMAAGTRLIVKIDVEGAECEICLHTEPSAWAPVDELFVESHPFARCGVQAMLEQLGRAGFVATARPGPVLRLARPGPRA